MAVQQNDLFEAVIRQRPCDIQHMVDEVFVVAVDGARKIHHVAGIAVGNNRQHQHFVRDLLSRPFGDSGWAHQVDVQR